VEVHAFRVDVTGTSWTRANGCLPPRSGCTVPRRPHSGTGVTRPWERAGSNGSNPTWSPMAKEANHFGLRVLASAQIILVCALLCAEARLPRKSADVLANLICALVCAAPIPRVAAQRKPNLRDCRIVLGYGTLWGNTSEQHSAVRLFVTHQRFAPKSSKHSSKPLLHSAVVQLLRLIVLARAEAGRASLCAKRLGLAR